VKNADGATKNAENKPINVKEDEVTLKIVKDADGETKNAGNKPINMKENKVTLEIMKDANGETKNTRKVLTNVKEDRDAIEIMKGTYGATKIKGEDLPRKSSNRKELVKNDLAANNDTIKYSTKPSRLQEVLRALRKERKIPKIIPFAEIQQDVDKPFNHKDEIIKPKVGSTIVKLKKSKASKNVGDKNKKSEKDEN